MNGFRGLRFKAFSMIKTLSCLGIGLFLTGGLCANPMLKIDASSVKASVSPVLYGAMTEEANHAYEGGLYGELIQNRILRDDAKKPAHWSVVQAAGGRAAISLDESQPIGGTVLKRCLKLDAEGAFPGHRAGVANDGYWGIAVRPKTTYRLSFYAKAQGAAGPLTASLESDEGSKVLATAQIPEITNEWRKYTATLTTGEDVKTSARNRFVISTETPGVFWFDLVSLFPPTYRDRPNGNRVDLMEFVGDLKATFLRFPGGNFLDGDVIPEHFPWKQTVGPLEQRPGHRGCWKYGASDGMGLLEFLEWCEDLHLEPVLAVYGGFSLNAFTVVGEHVKPGPDLQPYVDDALDEIEYVTGDTNTKWGAQRAKDGHSAPFPLTYVEVGNEDGFDSSQSYDARFAQFFDAIRTKYPKLKCIASTGGEDWGGQRVKVKSRVPYAYDEHYYRRVWEMEYDAAQFDHYDRGGPKRFIGEWASIEGKPTTDMNAALGDAAWMTGIERNADLIVMSCYAPLTRNVDDPTPGDGNMIGFDAVTVYGAPTYYAQKMFFTHLGKSVLDITGVNIPVRTYPEQKNKPKPGESWPEPPRGTRIPTLFYVATKDEKAIYLKVVNTAGQAQAVNIDLKGAGNVAPEGTLITLSSSSPNDTNSISEPRKIVPVSTKVTGIGSAFTQTFAPYSINVLQIGLRNPR